MLIDEDLMKEHLKGDNDYMLYIDSRILLLLRSGLLVLQKMSEKHIESGEAEDIATGMEVVETAARLVSVLSPNRLAASNNADLADDNTPIVVNDLRAAYDPRPKKDESKH
jgi:hypothetical protein